ncbi:DNA-3-methyladenine glycosylase [Haloprofundus sp. MHR1]|uniref:DNA-3-methyladenine glycosylase family protein n=1 Tax=Haloprofundus sp. MHR1 TaxID=2572921 RepID=UPI0010BF5253|nr:DNA-3-methyladenine glycosylase [Haloprofundus sp. MHR1]QCJ46476.1 DNA-3-methyladenine glycosylase 2 family protein [Haloprofundus sp. MHR1]
MTDEAETVLRRDPVMAELIDRHDPYSEPNWSEYERLCISIINQQLSTASAAAVRERVFELLEGDVTPEAVLDADEAALRDAGLSRMKTEYLRNAARAFRRNDYTKEGLAAHTDDEVVDRLTEIKGVGEWTARMYLLFVLEREDVLPLGDLAVRRGIELLYGDGEEMTRAEMREVAEAWRPFRSVATKYIWAEYESDS